mmetsp:Transcript_16852/g.16101  ORF Transcript_16852/g.16101 Transcript_16852/m.16101 type:complete len:131 (+) Transcript_16852:376-768(+)
MLPKHAALLGRIDSQRESVLRTNCTSNAAFKGDRFIPFRGTQEHYFEEYMLTNDTQKENKQKSQVTQAGRPQGENQRQEPSERERRENNQNLANRNANNAQPSNQDNSDYSSNNSSSSNNMDCSRGSGHK